MSTEFQQPQQNSPFGTGGPQVNLPNAVAVLVLGIVSIVGCFCYGIVGTVCGIIALVLAKKDLILFRNNPTGYTQSSYNNLKAGRVCAIIGLILSALCLIYIIVVFCIFGSVILSNPGAWRHTSGY